MTTKHAVSNSDNVIDSRDVIARMDELKDSKQDAQDVAVSRCLACGTEMDAPEKAEYRHPESKQPFCSQACGSAPDEDYIQPLAELYVSPWNEEMYLSLDFGEDEAQELHALEVLENEASGSPDWTYGETLVRDSYFTEFAQELADDIGAIEHNAQWPNNYIDWERAADALKQDYMQVDYDGVEYWIRA